MNPRAVEILIKAKNMAKPVFTATEKGLKGIQTTGKKAFTNLRTSANKFATSLKTNAVKAIAGVVAGIMAMQKAWSLIELGTKAEAITVAFDTMGTRFGINTKSLISDLKKISGETINMSNVFAKASSAIMTGIKPDQIVRLMELARDASMMTGKSVEEAFNEITGAIVGGFTVTMKRNYGLVVDVGVAVERYAKILGKAKGDLTEYERTQALVNLTLEKGKVLTESITNTQRSSFETIQKMKAEWLGLKETLGQVLFFVAKVSIAVVKMANATIVKMMSNLSDAVLNQFYKIAKLANVVNKDLGLTLFKAIRKVKGEIKTLRTSADDLVKSAYDLSFGFVEQKETHTKTTEKVVENLETIKEKNKEVAEKMKSTWRDMVSSNSDIFETGMRSSFSNMVSAFDSIFYDGLTNRFRGLNDILINFGQNMIKVLTMAMAQKAVGGLVGALFGGGSTVAGVGATEVGTTLAYDQTSTLGASIFHKGGKIKAHDGLAPDEVPIIAQTGERILSRKQNDLFEQKLANGGGEQQAVENHYYINAVDPRSFSQLVMNNPQAIQEVVSMGMRKNQSVRKYIKKYG